jgi:hypothetical protein
VHGAWWWSARRCVDRFFFTTASTPAPGGPRNTLPEITGRNKSPSSSAQSSHSHPCVVLVRLLPPPRAHLSVYTGSLARRPPAAVQLCVLRVRCAAPGRPVSDSDAATATATAAAPHTRLAPRAHITGAADARPAPHPDADRQAPTRVGRARARVESPPWPWVGDGGGRTHDGTGHGQHGAAGARHDGTRRWRRAGRCATGRVVVVVVPAWPVQSSAVQRAVQSRSSVRRPPRGGGQRGRGQS